jgi:hypothetical protein
MLPSSASTTSNLAVTGVSGTVENRPARQVKLRNTRDPVGFQNLATAADQRFQAADSYWLIKPPRIGRRRILAWTGSGTGVSGRGGRSCSAR